MEVCDWKKVKHDISYDYGFYGGFTTYHRTDIFCFKKIIRLYGRQFSLGWEVR